MDASGSSSEAPPGRLQKPGPWPHRIEPFVPRTDHNPQELKSWARRTGFNPNLSGETSSVVSDRDAADEPQAPARLDLENGIRRRGDGFPRKPEIEPVIGRGRNGAEDRGVEIGPAPARAEKEKRKVTVEPLGVGIKDERREVGNELLLRVKSDGPVRNGHDNGAAPVFPVKADEDPKAEAQKDERGVEIDFFSDDQEPEDPSGYKQPSDFQSTVTDHPGIMFLMFYGVQHCLSLAGSLVFTPLIMVPAMGGTDVRQFFSVFSTFYHKPNRCSVRIDNLHWQEETTAVISTMLLVSGVTTIMHSYFGSRLPLVQGSSFVYLAPALVIINSEEYRNLNENKFKHIMRELQGAVVVGSVFQAVLGYSGLMSLLLRERIEPPLPSEYFGNCIGGNFVHAKAVDLAGEDGVVAAARLIGEAIEQFKEDPLKDADKWPDKYQAIALQRPLGVAGSPGFKVYDVDFGWGRPVKVDLHMPSITWAGAISVSESRDETGGVEVGLVAPKTEMDEFEAHFSNGLHMLQ